MERLLDWLHLPDWRVLRYGMAVIPTPVMVSLFGESGHAAVYLALDMIVADYATGLLKAIYRSELSSAVGFKGLVRKTAMVGFIAAGHLLDRHLGTSGQLLQGAAYYVSSIEAISLLENLEACGVPLPGRLSKLLAAARDKRLGQLLDGLGAAPEAPEAKETKKDEGH